MRAVRLFALVTILPFLLSPGKVSPSPGLFALERSTPSPSVAATAPPASLSAESAILIDGNSGECYCEKNADARLKMASTTKIMTALVILESLPLEAVVTVPPEAVGVEGSSIYLYAGERLTVESLLYALLLASANDAAAALAIAASGSIEAFAAAMNARAASLGLRDTHFENPHGLDAEDHYTTARDLAAITRAAMQNETFRKIVSSPRKTIPHGEGGSRYLTNHNRLLKRYDGCVGVKTGFTRKSGRCLVSAAERDGLLLIAVTLSAPDDWNDHAALLDYGFSRYESVTLASAGQTLATLPVFNSPTPTLTVSCRDTLTLTLPRTHGEITSILELPHYLWGEVKADEAIGRIRFYADGAEIASLPLYADADAEEISYRLGILDRLAELFP